MPCRSSHRPDRMHPTANTPPLCGRIFPYPLLSASQPPANTLLYTVSTSLCSPLLPSAPLCSPLLPSAPRRDHLRDPAPRPKSPHKKKPHRAPGRSHCRPHAPLPRNRQLSPFAPRRPKRNDPKAAPQTQKKAPAQCAGAVSDAPRKAERRRENYFAIPFMIAPETPGAAWYSPNE